MIYRNIILAEAKNKLQTPFNMRDKLLDQWLHEYEAR